MDDQAEADGDGSSPRGRGTGSDRVFQRHPARFIPAWAGNRCQQCEQRSFKAVHPRVGGEQMVRSYCARR